MPLVLLVFAFLGIRSATSCSLPDRNRVALAFLTRFLLAFPAGLSRALNQSESGCPTSSTVLHVLLRSRTRFHKEIPAKSYSRHNAFL